MASTATKEGLSFMDLPAEVRTMVYEYTVTESFKLERKQIKKTYGLIDAIVKNVSPLCVLPVSTQIQYDCIAAIGPKFHLTLRLERHYKQAGAGGGDLTELLKCPACIFNTFRHVTVELVPPPTVPREPPPGGLMYPRYLHACHNPRIITGWLKQLPSLKHIKLVLRLDCSELGPEMINGDERLIEDGILRPKQFWSMSFDEADGIESDSLVSFEKAILVDIAIWGIPDFANGRPGEEYKRMSDFVHTYPALPVADEGDWCGLSMQDADV